MKRLWILLLVVGLGLPVVAVADSIGGGGDAGGVDILPKPYTFYALVPGGGGDGDGLDILPGPSPIADYLFNGDDLPDFELHGGDGQIDLRGSFGDPIEDPQTGAMVTPVHLSGTLFGEMVSEGGYAVPTADGRLCLIDSDTWNSSDYPCCCFRFWNEDSLASSRFSLRLNPAELGDGNGFDDVGGSCEHSQQGIPLGRFVVTY